MLNKMRSEIAIKASRNEARVPVLRHALENYTRVFNRLAGTDWTARRALLAHHAALAGVLLLTVADPVVLGLAIWTAAAVVAAVRRGGAR